MTTVRTDKPLERFLYPGWNLIGNPFAFDLPFDKLSVASGTVDVRSYDGVWSEHDGPLQAGQGYAVHNSLERGDTLFFDPDLSAVDASLASKRSGSEDWAIGISAAKGRARDTDNVAVVSSAASTGWDSLDRPEPPVIGDYVSVSFEGERFPLAVDARPAGGPWIVVVKSATHGIIDVSFDLPQGVSASVYDGVFGTSQNLNANPHYALVSGGEGFERRLELRTGNSFEEVPPAAFALDPVFPNPVQDAATIVYRIPQSSTMTLSVYDLLGRRVRTLKTGPCAAGTHHLVFDAANLAPGVYAIQLKAGGRSHTRMLTVR
jgi:hypothetical protein